MIYTIQNACLTVQVKKAGAELCSVKDTAGAEYLFDANPAYWGRSAPVLFPFVGSLRDKAFVYEGNISDGTAWICKGHGLLPVKKGRE